MATTSFCNICLITGVKMEILEATDINSFIDTNGLPLLACYECATVAGKVKMLLNKYYIAQTILENILETQDRITEEELKSIDRKSFMLESNLECCTQPLIISFDTKPERDLIVQSNNHHKSKGDEQEEKFSIIEEFEGDHESKIGDEFEDDNFLSECEETKTFEVVEVSDSADSNGLNNQMKNIIDNDCIDQELLKILDNCHDNDNFLEQVDGIMDKLYDVDKITNKKRKTRVLKRLKKNKDNKKIKPDSRLDIFEITTLTRSEQIKEFSKRKESVNYTKNAYKCELCFRGFNYLTTYETHVKLSHDPGLGQFKCPVCSVIKKNSRQMNQHINGNHRQLYKCKRCDFICTSQPSAINHKKWHDGAVYNCRFCGQSFQKLITRLGHERLKHPSEFLCDLCGLPFVSAHGIRAHKRKAHIDHKESTEEADPQLYCEECKIQFASSFAWQTHLQHSIKHNPHKLTTGTPTPQPWKPVCRFCGDECKDRVELRAHQLAKHHNRAARQSKQYPTQCNYVKGSLSYHVQMKHTEVEKRFECDHCHAKFPSKLHLSGHMQRHSPHPANLCSQCGKLLKSKASFRIHNRNVHGGPRPHKCRFCQKTFIQGSLLKVHVNEVHLGLAKKRIRTRKKENS